MLACLRGLFCVAGHYFFIKQRFVVFCGRTYVCNLCFQVLCVWFVGL